MKYPTTGHSSSEPLRPGDLVKFLEEPQTYIVLRRYFSDRYLNDIVEVLTPEGQRSEFFEEYLEKV